MRLHAVEQGSVYTLHDFVEKQGEHTVASEEHLAEFHAHIRDTVLSACQADLTRLEERLQVGPCLCCG